MAITGTLAYDPTSQKVVQVVLVNGIAALP
jgi:hypothetical protein